MQAVEATQDLIQELRQAIDGEAKFDQITRHLYSTDASSYQILPVGVVIPRTPSDVSAAVEISARHNVPLVPRGGGTSLSGQTVGPGIIIDNSRHLTQILELNTEEKWVRVQAGCVLDQLNRALLPHGLMVGPDPASSASATLGGMTGNNSTGTHSIKYGMISDHLLEIDTVLSDGSTATFGPQSEQAITALARRDTLEGKLYRDILPLLEQYGDEIKARFPKIWRNVAGYNLNRLQDAQAAGRPFSLAPLIAGSEGTLVTITSIKLGLVSRPKMTRLLMVNFDALRPAMEAVPIILEHNPAAVELIDRFFINLTRQTVEFGSRLTFVDGDPRCLLMVEFAGDTPQELAAQAEAVEATLRRHHHQGTIIHQTTDQEIANMWAVRKAGFGLLMSMRGDAKALAFADDATVPVDTLPSYTAQLEDLFRNLGTEASFFAHVSAGCVHINPLVNLKTEAGLRLMEDISRGITDAALAHGGTSTGEHGEGIARSIYNEQMYGPKLHQAFREVKGLFDPQNRMNPGKIIDAPEPWEPELLRINPTYRTPYAPKETWLDFSSDKGFAGLVEMCNGQGTCRKVDTGVMCPSYNVTRDEAHSTRGRANALRSAISGQLGPDGLNNKELYEVLDLCLECKGCKRECPTTVDMSKLKYEFLAQYQATNGVPLRSRLFANVAFLNRLGSIVPGLANWGYKNGLVRGLLDSWLGIDKRRAFPTIAPQTFQKWFKRHTPAAKATRGKVILWDDTYLSYNDPEIGQATVKILEAAGFEVQLIEQRKCCGRPMISKGLLSDARKNAEHNVALLAPFAAQGIPIVGLEPSCVATFRDEYPDLLRSDAARQVAQNSFFIEEFLSNLAAQGKLDLPFATPSEPRHILVHGHCYQKALTTTGPLLAMLNLLPNTTVEEIPSGCCGMAGAFGYEKEHYDLSQAVGEERLLPAVRAADESTIIVAAGTSCRHQIIEGTGREPVHPIIALADALG